MLKNDLNIDTLAEVLLTLGAELSLSGKLLLAMLVEGMTGLNEIGQSEFMAVAERKKAELQKETEA